MNRFSNNSIEKWQNFSKFSLNFELLPLQDRIYCRLEYDHLLLLAMQVTESRDRQNHVTDSQNVNNNCVGY